MNGSPYLHDIETSGMHELTEFQCSAKEDAAPGWITKPALNAAVYSPKAPAPEFADYKPSSRLEHAGHFHNRSLAISNEAKRGHRKDKVKFCILEWQPFRPSFDKMQLSALNFGPLSRSSDHSRICIEPNHDRTTPGKFRCKRCIAAADVEQSLAGNRTGQFEEELPL
jgi:hypothetical protein